MRRLTKSLSSRPLLMAWLILCVLLFIVASRVSYLQGFFPQDAALFLAHLARIAPLTYLLDLLCAFGGMLLFALAALTFGLRLLPRRILPLSLGRGVTAFLLGEIFFSLLFLTVIRLGGLPPLFVAATLTLAFLLGLPALIDFLRHLPRPSLPADFRRSERILLALTLMVLALGLSLSSARLGYDAVAEYFSHAKIMAVSQRPIFFYPKDSFVVSSFHPGILLTAQIQLFGDQSARMLSWLNGTAILLLVLVLSEQMGLSPRARLYALVMLVTSTAFVDLLGDGKIELISTAPILAAVYLAQDLSCVEQAREQSCAARLFFIGLLAGFAIISRPYNIFLVPLFGVLFFVAQIFSLCLSLRWRVGQIPNLSTQVKDLHYEYGYGAFWLSLPLVLLGVFHLWQNALWLGSPLAPLTYARELNTDIWQWQFDPALLNRLKWIYPLTLTFFNTPQSLGNISPLFMGFLPFLLIPTVRRTLSLSPQMRSLLFATLLTLLAWVMLFFTVVEIRYVLFLWVLLFLPAAQVIEGALEHSGKLLQPLLCSLMVLLLGFLGIRTLAIGLDTYSPIDADGWAHCYDVSLCAFFEPVNQSAAPGERVLALNAYRYYLRPDLFACSSQSDEYPAIEALARQNSPDFWAEAYRWGYRFVLYEKNFSEFHSHFGKIPASEIAPSWLAVTALTQTSWGVVYRLDALNPPFAVGKQCRQAVEGKWEVVSAGK